MPEGDALTTSYSEAMRTAILAVARLDYAVHGEKALPKWRALAKTIASGGTHDTKKEAAAAASKLRASYASKDEEGL